MVLTPGFEQTVDVEHVHPRPRILKCHPLLDERRTQQIREPDGRRAGAEEEVLLVLQLGPLQAGGVDHAGERDARRALHVVVVDAVLVAIPLQQMHRVHTGPVLEVDAALRKNLLHRLDELVNERIQLLCRGPRLAQTQVERVAQVLLVVGSRVQIHRQQPLRRDAGRCGVELQLADRNTHTVGAQVT